MSYQEKYLKYKKKYNNIKKQYGGYPEIINDDIKKINTNEYEVSTNYFDTGIGILMIFVSKNNDNNIDEVNKVVLCQSTNKHTILDVFRRHYDENAIIYTIIKSPGYSVSAHRGNDHTRTYENVIENEEFWATNIAKTNCQLILVPYFLNRENEKTTLCFRVRNDGNEFKHYEYNFNYNNYASIK